MKLSVRETQILRLLCHGLTNKAIAQQLKISPHTVRDRISVMILRYGLQTRVALAALHTHKSAPRQAVPTRERRASGERRIQTSADTLHM